jgi:diacylglycerol kinase (ATP)
MWSAADMTEQQKINGTGLARILRAITCSKTGITTAFRNEEAFRQEVILCAVMLPLALWLGQTNVERALLVASLLLVLIVEVLNTAIEVVVNRIGIDRHELSGLAKDLGSAAVSMAIFLTVVVWGLVLLT